MRLLYYILFVVGVSITACNQTTVITESEDTALTSYVNTFIGSEPLLDPDFIGYTPPDGWRVWAGLTHPGPALPFAMVQMSPITEFGTGSGYQYEDDFIHAFAHTNMGHWNYGQIPVIPVAGNVTAGSEIGSYFSKENESAAPGYYRVHLDDYNITVELTSTLRTGNHRYTYAPGEVKKVVFDLSRSNNRIRDWQIEQVSENTLSGYQNDGSMFYFYSEFNESIENFRTGTGQDQPLSVITLESDGSSESHLQSAFT